MKKISNQSGFTIIEIAVVVPIMIVIALGLFQALFTMVQTTDSEKARINLSYTKQVAMDAVESDVRLTSTFLPTLASGLTDNYQNFSNGGAWSYKGADADHRVLILQEYATVGNPLSANRQIVYSRTPNNNCTNPSVAKNDIIIYNVIFFVQDRTLFRRRVTDPSNNACSAFYQQLSCPTKDYLQSKGINSRNGQCKADDEQIATDIQSFSVDYYTSGASSTKIDVYSNGADPAGVTSARSVNVTIVQGQKAGGSTVTSSIDLRIATLNSDITGGN